jgi:molybdopterin synthase sulfur carrier subunit
LRAGQAAENFKGFFSSEIAELDCRTAGKEAPLLAVSAQGMARCSCAGYNSVVSLSSQTVRVKVLFFGRLKEIVGHAEDSVELPDGSPIEALFSHYGVSHPELGRFRASLVASRNQEFAAWSTPLHSGDEVAFLPPVSGG